jgi:flagellar biosynthesis/type III secretory pathway protein FliH
MLEKTDKKEVGEYVEELSLYIDSAAPMDLKEKVRKKIKTAIITGENRMSSIKEYFKEEGRKEGIEQGLKGVEQAFKQGTEQGFKQGTEQGFKQGTEQGFKQGTEQGFKQGTEKGIEKVALRMLKNGESTEKVVLYTGLSKEKVSSLHEQLMKNNGKNGKAHNS